MGISVLNKNVEILVDCQNVVGESPLWCAEKQALYWVATLERKIFCFFMDSGVVQHWDMPEIPGCIALGDNGDLIVAMESGIFEVSLSGHKSRISLLQKCPPSFNGMRFNDGKCDRQGRFLAGSMKFPLSPEAAGVLYRLDHNKHLSPVIHGLITQNGLAWSRMGKKCTCRILTQADRSFGNTNMTYTRGCHTIGSCLSICDSMGGVRMVRRWILTVAIGVQQTMVGNC